VGLEIRIRYTKYNMMATQYSVLSNHEGQN